MSCPGVVQVRVGACVRVRNGALASHSQGQGLTSGRGAGLESALGYVALHIQPFHRAGPAGYVSFLNQLNSMPSSPPNYVHFPSLLLRFGSPLRAPKARWPEQDPPDSFHAATSSTSQSKRPQYQAAASGLFSERI